MHSRRSACLFAVAALGPIACAAALLVWSGGGQCGVVEGGDGGASAAPPVPYVVVDTGQTSCYDDRGRVISPKPGEPFYGQDAQFNGPQPAYQDNGDGTVSDLNTALMWVQARGGKITWDTAVAGAAACRVGGHDDWRVPTIKELYSLIDFDGRFHPEGNSVPYLDTKHFGFAYGNEAAGERPIDCQDWSATQYVGTTMGGNATVFGVNFADGRIKGYPRHRGPRGVTNALYVRYVRGNPAYGQNDFLDNGDETITDRATGLMWQQADSGKGLNWEQALAYAEGLELAGHDDWRLPKAKELQSIVDYTRAPAVAHSPAIDPVFRTSTLRDGDYPWYWTGTTHLDGPPDVRGSAAVYVCFGTAWGCMGGQWLDVHGAGAQRSDPKTGDPAWFPYGRGPQGDQIRIYNYVRCVRTST